MGGYTDHQSLEATGATVVPYGVGNSRALINAIREIKIDAIHCTPSYLDVLERILRQDFKVGPRSLGLKLGLFGGESGIQDGNFRRHIELTWGLKAMNANYGMADVLSMFGSECYLQEGMHFMGQGSLLVELIGQENSKVLPIEKGVRGELVLTNINRQAQPVIRYRTGDLVEIVDHNPCRCGRKSFKFNVIGRCDDMIVVKGVNIFPELIKNRLGGFLNEVTGKFQINLDTRPPLNELNLTIECRGKPDNRKKERLTNLLRDDFAANISVRPLIALVPEGALPSFQDKAELIVKRYRH
jgi:phenylacetate-CoA ligase